MQAQDTKARLEEIDHRRAEIELTNDIMRKKIDESKDLITRTRAAYEKLVQDERKSISTNEHKINEQTDEFCRLGKEKKELLKPKKVKQ